MTRNTLWTPEEDAALATAVADNVSPPRLAVRLQRSLSSVKRRIRELGLTGDNRKSGEIRVDPLIQARRWMTAAKTGDLPGLIGLYSEDATLECACTGPAVYAGPGAIWEYWAQRLRSPAPLAFSLLKATRDDSRVVVDYLSYEAKPVRMFLSFSEDGKISRSECAPRSCYQSAA